MAKSFYSEYTDKKFVSSRKQPSMEDSKMTPSDPQNGYGETTKILTREELAKLP